MTCPHCAAPVLADAEVCPVCGRTLLPSAESTRPGMADLTGRYLVPPASGVSPPSYSAPNPYAPPPGYPPPGWAPPLPPASVPAAGYLPPGYPPGSPYGAPPGNPVVFPAYPYAAPPRRNSAAFLWSGVGLLLLSLFLSLSMVFVLVSVGQDATYTATRMRNTQLGALICVLGALIALGVPGLILLIVGLRRRA